MKLNFFIVTILLFSITAWGHGQTSSTLNKQSIQKKQSKKRFPVLTAHKIALIAEELDEISGLATTANHFWGNNDSLGESAIYAFDKQSLKLAKIVYIEGATNFDWEELAQDDDFIYIADTGDNIAFRRSVDIYKVAKIDLETIMADAVLGSIEQRSTVKSVKLKIRYAAKNNFLPTKEHNFDSEALTVVGDSLWLFTKNRLNQQTSLYKLDKKAKEQKISAALELPVQGLITAADYNADNNKLLLLGYSQHSPNWGAFIWVMDVVDQMPVWKSAKRYKIEPYGQWEAIKWISDTQFVTAAEDSRHSKQTLGYFKLPN
jgi:hypothetical protein